MTLAVSGTYTSSALAVTVAATLVVVGLFAALIFALRAARQLRRQADELRGQVESVLSELEGTVAHAVTQIDRVDELIGRAELLSDAVGSASRVAYGAVATPVIKAMALGAGTARASQRLRLRSRSRQAGRS